MAADEQSVRRSPARVRNLSVEELGLKLPSDANAVDRAEPSLTAPEPLPADDELVSVVRELLESYGGVIFTGPPGTSKSYYAARIAVSLAGSSARVRFVQFHPSYHYEDFVEGYVPTQNGFALQPKHLLEMVAEAEASPDLTFVIVIDELSRGDAARAFGEALTYVEKTKRGLAFSLASGGEASIPPNLLFIATMNPFDRGVDEVDAAFERRFAKIALDPSVEILKEMLDQAGLSEPTRSRVIAFFLRVNAQARENPYGALGHTYFLGMTDAQALSRLWDHQLRFFFERAYQLDQDSLDEIKRGWDRIFADSTEGDGGPGPVPTGSPEAPESG